MIDLATNTYTHFGTAHVVCNNAGVGGGGGLIWEIPQSGWDWTFGVNLMGRRARHPRVRAAPDRAAARVTSSTPRRSPGSRPLPFMAPYTATKHAVVGISESLGNRVRDDRAPGEGRQRAVPRLHPDPARTSPTATGPTALGDEPELGRRLAAIGEMVQRPGRRRHGPGGLAQRVVDAVRADGLLHPQRRRARRRARSACRRGPRRRPARHPRRRHPLAGPPLGESTRRPGDAIAPESRQLGQAGAGDGDLAGLDRAAHGPGGRRIAARRRCRRRASCRRHRRACTRRRRCAVDCHDVGHLAALEHAQHPAGERARRPDRALGVEADPVGHRAVELRPLAAGSRASRRRRRRTR